MYVESTGLYVFSVLSFFLDTHTLISQRDTTKSSLVIGQTRKILSIFSPTHHPLNFTGVKSAKFFLDF